MHDTFTFNRMTLAVSLGLFGLTTHAEDNAEGALPVVTVTTEHRSADLQKAPLEISAFDENALEDKQIKSIRDLSRQVQNLTLSRQSISYSAQTYGIRGIAKPIRSKKRLWRSTPMTCTSQIFWNANSRYISGDAHWTTRLSVKRPLDRAYPQAIGYVPSSSTRYYSVNDPRTLLLSVRYDL